MHTKGKLRNYKGSDYSDRYVWRRGVTACLNVLTPKIEVVMGGRWRESTSALNLLSIIDDLLNRVDPKAVLVEYLAVIGKEDLKPRKGLDEEVFELVDHVDTFLAFEESINDKLLRGIKNTLDSIRPSFFAVKHAKEVLETCINSTCNRKSLLFSEYQNCTTLQAKCGAEVDWADYCKKNDTFALTWLEEACAMDKRLYELELKQAQVLNLIPVSVDFEQLSELIEEIIDQLEVDGFAEFVNDAIQRRLIHILTESFKDLLSSPCINIGVEFKNGRVHCNMSEGAVRMEIESRWSEIKGMLLFNF